MIQRKQSIFLLLAAISYCLIYFVPVAHLSPAEGSESQLPAAIYISQLQSSQSDLNIVQVFPLTLPILLICLAVIFLFKNRKLQMKLVMVNILLLFGFLILIGLSIKGYYTYAGNNEYKMSLSFGLVFPVLSLILMFIAYKAIKKDEELVRAADRLR